MPEHPLIARQLVRVRRAWKRTAVLSGMAIVIVEALGIPLVAFLIDVLFRPGKAGRIAILAMACLAVLCFAAKHVAAPLFRRISDKQLALYVEEHSSEFEGALLAATEFGPAALPDDLDYPLVQSILREAELRAKEFDVRSAVDLSRLRKYGALAALVCLLYVGIGVLFPEPVSRHAKRILVPWEEEHEPEREPPDLAPFLTAAWGIHIRKPVLPQQEFERQTEQLAEQRINPDTAKVWQFVKAERAVTQQQADFINNHARQGHDALKAHDTAKALEELRVAGAQVVALKLAENLAERFSLAGGTGFGTADNAVAREQARLASLEQQAPQAQQSAQQLLESINAAEEAKELADKVAELEKQETKLVGSATRLAEDKRTRQPNVSKGDERAWAGDQRRVAEAARKTVADAKRQTDQTDAALNKATEGLVRAAQRMQEAAKDMQAGRADQATREATVAREELAAVREQLTGASQDQFADVLNEAERRAQRLTDQQQEVRDRTEDLAKDATGRERQYEAVAADQAAVKRELASLERAIGTLERVAGEGNVKRETAAHVEEAQQDMRRSRIEQRVTNAAVELSMRNARGAEPEQDKALQAPKRVLDKVRHANDSLASDAASELRRAKAEAQRAKEQLSQLNPKAAAKLQGKPPTDARSVQGQRRAELAEDTAMTLTQMKRHIEAVTGRIMTINCPGDIHCGWVNQWFSPEKTIQSIKMGVNIMWCPRQQVTQALKVFTHPVLPRTRRGGRCRKQAASRPTDPSPRRPPQAVRKPRRHLVRTQTPAAQEAGKVRRRQGGGEAVRRAVQVRAGQRLVAWALSVCLPTVSVGPVNPGPPAAT